MIKKMKKILAISYYYLPSNAPRAIQVSRLIENTEHEIDLITSFPYNNHKQRNPKNINVVSYKRNTLIRYLDFLADKCRMSLNRIPDQYLKWAKTVENYIENNEIDLKKYDIIMTFGQPMSTHLLGVALKNKYSIPWIAHFSDPWVDNPYSNYNFWSLKKNIQLEGQVFNTADKLVFTSEETIELVGGKHPDNVYKMEYLPHMGDPKIMHYKNSHSEKKADKYIIRYVGNFYSRRSPEPLYKAVEELYEQNIRVFNDVEIGIAGSLGDHVLVPLKYKRASQIIKLYGKVDYKTSIRLMDEADCLLIIDAPAKKSIFFPSKLADYVSLRKYVAAITPEGTTNRIVAKIGGTAADPTNNEQIKDMLIRIIRNKPREACFTEEFSPEIVRVRFEEIINDLI